MFGEAKKRKINTRGEGLLLQLPAEAEEEPVAMSRGAKEGTAAHCNVQRWRFLAYHQLPATAEDEPATAGNAIAAAGRGKPSLVRVILGKLSRPDIKRK